jgi:hypothetical protein
MIGAFVHSILWIIIWFQDGKIAFAMVFPPAECWSRSSSYVDYNGSRCSNENTHCRCDDLFVSMVGFAACLLFIALLLSSMWWVRRHYYRIFYICHLVFGSLSFLLLVMHWSCLIYYLCPSLVYYAATTIPVLLQALQSYCVGGTQIKEVTHIPNSGGCVEISLKLRPNSEAATIMEMTAARYVQICIPKVQGVWHPFTVYSTPGNCTAMQIIYRCYGPFTSDPSRPVLNSI